MTAASAQEPWNLAFMPSGDTEVLGGQQAQSVCEEIAGTNTGNLRIN
jgi:hypothetical protein